MLLSSIFVITLLVCLDQYTKSVIVSIFVINSSKEVISNFFYLTHVINTGAAWSILEGKQIFFIIISFIALGAFIYMLYKEKDKGLLYITSYLLIIGGTIGNLIDRIKNGYVVDFLDFKIFGYDFPVFNLADTFLTIGVFLLIISFVKESKHAKN